MYRLIVGIFFLIGLSLAWPLSPAVAAEDGTALVKPGQDQALKNQTDAAQTGMAQTGDEKAGLVDSNSALKGDEPVGPEPQDPFKPSLPYKNISIVYELQGRFKGEARLLISQGRSALSLEAIDLAYGLKRPVQKLTLIAEGRISEYDLLEKKVRVWPDFRELLSRAWQQLGRLEKSRVVDNATKFGLALAKPLSRKKASLKKVEVLGLPAVRINLKGRLVWYWSDTDLVLKEAVDVLNQKWVRTAVDIVTNARIPDSAFEAPEGLSGRISDKDRAETAKIIDRLIYLLARPVVSQAIEAKSARKQAVIFTKLMIKADKLELAARQQGADEDLEAKIKAEQAQLRKTRALLARRDIPWPSVPPPAFREEIARYLVSPTWQPYPALPWNRPVPALGLEADLLSLRSEQLAEMIIGSKKPKKNQ